MGIERNLAYSKGEFLNINKCIKHITIKMGRQGYNQR